VQRVAGLLLLTWQVGNVAAQPALQQHGTAAAYAGSATFTAT